MGRTEKGGGRFRSGRKRDLAGQRGTWVGRTKAGRRSKEPASWRVERELGSSNTEEVASRRGE